MSRGGQWGTTTGLNEDGLFVGYGTRTSDNENAATVRTMGNVEILQFPLNWDSLPASGTAPSVKSVSIPRHSTMVAGNFRVSEAFLSGTNIDFGTMNSAGTAIDDDGFDGAVTAAAMALNAVIDFNGALMNDIDVSIGTVDAFFATVVTGTFTAGKGIVTLEYIRPMPDSDARDPLGAITTRNPSLFV